MGTTALAALAWLKSPVFAPQTDKAVQWILAHRQADGTFGSALATMLAMEALCQSEGLGIGNWGSATTAAALAQGPRAGNPVPNPQSLLPHLPNAGTLTVDCDGRTIGRSSFAAGAREAIAIGGLEAALRSGENRLGINLSGDNKMPYLVTVAYHSAEPDQSDACPVRLWTTLTGSKVRRGQTVALHAELSNTSAQDQPATVAVLGLPAGLEVQPEQLEALKKAGTIDSYEVRPRELVLDWRSLAAKRQIWWKLDLSAAVPGKYVGPVSRAYLSDAPENKRWWAPLTVEITRD
jgi:hypothetical protein